MSDRLEINLREELSLEDLYRIMLDHWDTEKHNQFFLGERNALSEELCIYLPATKRFMVLVEPTVEGIFRKEPKIVLTVVETPKGMEETLRRSFPAGNVFSGVVKIGRLASIKKERKKVEDTILVEYTGYLREILEGRVQMEDSSVSM